MIGENPKVGMEFCDFTENNFLRMGEIKKDLELFKLE